MRLKILNESKIYESGSVVSFPKGRRFYNAIGTIGDRVVVMNNSDKIKPKELLEAWQEETQCSLPSVCPNKHCTGKNDRFYLVGAHVLTSPATSKIQNGDIVYIVPICRSCNSSEAQKEIELIEEVKGLCLVWDQSDVKKPSYLR